MGWKVAVCLLIAVHLVVGQGGLWADVDNNNNYKIMWNNSTLFSSSLLFLRANGEVYTSYSLVDHSSSQGSDTIGAFKQITFTYKFANITWSVWHKIYSPLNVIVFGQTWISGATGTQATTNSNDNALEPIAGFPSFTYGSGISSQLNWNSWNGPQMSFYSSHSAGIDSSAFSRSNSLSNGPHFFVDPSNYDTFILSAYDNFEVQACTDTTYNNTNFWSCGLVNTIPSVPANYTSSYILYAGNGVTNSMYYWGQLMKKVYNTTRIPDIKLQKLGYYTDNGAYYAIDEWTDPPYEVSTMGSITDLFTKLVQKLSDQGIPLAYMSLDGWWYIAPSGPCGSPLRARSDILPTGLGGLSKALGMPLDVYANGYCEGDITVPNWSGWAANYFPMPNYSYVWYQQQFSNWSKMGMGAYEIDFMDSFFTGSPVLYATLNGAYEWLLGMSKAAEETGVGIQYCGTFGKQILESLQYPGVTNARVSNDFDCWENYWLISNILPWSLGLASSKDTFWTTANQPNVQNKGCWGIGLQNHNNSNVELHTAIVSLTDGPVGFSDALGYTNATLVMATCTSDGTLLHPTKTLTPIDALYTSNAPIKFSECATDPNTPCYNPIYQAHSTIPITASNGEESFLNFHYIINVAVQSYTLTARDIWPPMAGDFFYREWHTPCEGNATLSTCLDTGFPSVTFSTPFFNNETFILNWNLYIFSPRENSGWIFLGELAKFTTVSPNRVSKLTFSSSELQVSLMGAANEVVELTAISPKDVAVTQQCKIEANGTGSCSFSA